MNIKGLRVAAGLTQVQLAAEAGVKQTDISKWESGKANPNAKSLLRLAVGLKCQIDQIVAGVDDEYEPLRTRTAAPPTPSMSDEERAALIADLSRQLTAFLLLPDRMRRRMIRFPPTAPPHRGSLPETTPADPPAADATHGKRGRASDRVRGKRVR